MVCTMASGFGYNFLYVNERVKDTSILYIYILCFFLEFKNYIKYLRTKNWK